MSGSSLDLHGNSILGSLLVGIHTPVRYVRQNVGLHDNE